MEAAQRKLLGRFFKTMAQRRNVTQQELAHELGVDRSLLAKVNSGRMRTAQAYERVAQAFGLNLLDAIENARRLDDVLRSMGQVEEEYEDAEEQAETYVLTINAQKGGVGKTTAAVHLACAMADAGRSVLLVDLDPQGNATSLLSIESDGEHLNALLCAEEGQGPEELEILETPYGVDVIAGGGALARGSIALMTKPSGVKSLSHLLSALHGLYDYVVVDSPPGRTILTYNAICAADGVLVPVQPSGFSLDAIDKTIRVIDELVDTGQNPDVEYLGCFLTVYHKGLKTTREIERALKNQETSRRYLHKGSIRTDQEAVRAPKARRPMPKGSSARTDYERLLRLLEEKIYGAS